MGCHLIALGGTGQKTLEMLGYACACDALYTLDDDMRRQPLDILSVLTVDTTPQVPDALTRYQALRQVFAIGGQPRVGFHTQIEIDHLAIVPQERPSVQANATERDRLLLETLFASDLAVLNLQEGLKGHADLGMFFFADALSRLSEQLAQGEAHPFFDRIRQELDAGEDVKVLLAGSVYGGTGMSGLPSMARFLRGQFSSERLILGAVLTLPPHDPRTGDELNARAAAALYHYGHTGLMRHAPYDRTGLLDAAYLVRLTGNLYAASYARAAGSTQDDMRQLDFLSARTASQFFSTRFRGELVDTLGLYHIPRLSHQPSWRCFDDDRAYFRIRFGGLMRAAALELVECRPQIEQSLRGRQRLPQYMQPYFRAAKKHADQDDGTLLALFLEFHTFLQQFVRRMGEIQRVLPPPVPGRAEADCFFMPDALQTLTHLVSGSAEPADPAALRRLRDAMPALVSGGADTTFTWKHMLAAVAKGRRPQSDTPAAGFAAYAAALFSAAALGTAGLPPAVLPPPDSFGFDPNHRLVVLARSLPLTDAAPYCDAPDILAWETRLSVMLSLPYAQSVQRPEVIRWRGLIAMLLLWDGWELRHTLPELVCGPPPEGAATRAVLAAMPKERLNAGMTLFTLQKDVDGVVFEGPLGLLSERTALLSAADPHKLYGLIPPCVRWYDKDTQTFSDPCPSLNETDRARLVHRLKCLQALVERAELKSPLLESGALYAAADAFLGDLQNRHNFWLERFERDDQHAIHALYIRTLAVFGPPIEGLERQEEELSLQDLKQNPLMKRLLGEPEAAKRGLNAAALFSSEPMTSYFYKGVPFAMDSQRYLLTPASAEGEEEVLAQLEAVITGMFSPAYHTQAAKKMLAIANRLTSRPGASKKAVSLLRAWSVKHSKMAAE
ncbi:MAG TPA: hypothetical protein PKU80_01205 [Candidatus Limiplasma sp.]|nr:hypothetical protein [Candidatus Limiplasma sp.]